MPVKAWIDGHAFDLETLAELFREGEPMVDQEDGQYYLTSVAFDGLFLDGSQLNEAATSILRRANGIARAINSGYRPVTLAGRFTDETGATSVVLAIDSIEVRSKAYVATVVVDGQGHPQPLPPPPGPEYFAKIASNPAIGEALHILGKPDAALDWYDLYKLYEIVRDDVGGESDLKAKGWAPWSEIKTFTESANRREISGDDARHARLSGAPSGRSMTIGDGRELVRRLIASWLGSL